MDDSLLNRGKTLENQFFREKDTQLLEKLKAEMEGKEAKEALAAASGITDPAVLESLSANNVTAESLTSVSLVPLISVAWADGTIDDKEREAVLKAAAGAGLSAGSAAHDLVTSWLNDRPGSDLMESWKSYVGGLKSTMPAEAFGQVKTSVLKRAKDVADAAGGFLGLGKTSDAESKVIEEMEKAFD